MYWINSTYFQINSYPLRDSNRRPTAWEAADLPMSQLASSTHEVVYWVLTVYNCKWNQQLWLESNVKSFDLELSKAIKSFGIAIIEQTEFMKHSKDSSLFLSYGIDKRVYSYNNTSYLLNGMVQLSDWTFFLIAPFQWIFPSSAWYWSSNIS